MAFEPFGERPALPVALRALDYCAPPGRDRGCRRAGRGLADFHVDDGQALPFARIRNAVDLDRVERRDPCRRRDSSAAGRPQVASTRARSSGVSTPGPGDTLRVGDDDREPHRERAQLFQPFAPFELGRRRARESEERPHSVRV